MALCVINLPGMKALCDSEMISGRKGLTLFAVDFEIMRVMTFERLIGRRSFGLFGCLTFGMRTIWVWFK